MLGSKIKIGLQLEREQKRCRVHFYTEDEIVLEFVDEKTHISMPFAKFYQEMNAGIIQYAQPRRVVMQPSPLVTEEDRALAEKLTDYLTALESEAFPCSHKTRVKVIEAVANKRGDFGKNRPSASALYRWYKGYSSPEVGRNVAVMVTPSKSKRGRKASSAIIDMFYEVVDEYYLVPSHLGGCSVQDAFDHFQSREEAYLSSLPVAERAEARRISRSVFYEMIKQIDPYEVCVAREGRAVANNRYRISKEHYICSRPLERVQIDAVHINLGLIDYEGKYVGMPVVFFAIDVFTRAIVGYVISYAKTRREELSAATDLVKCIINPKEKPSHTVHGWPLSGIPEVIQHDSGVFRSAQFSAFLLNANIEKFQNPAMKAWVNAYIERFHRTFRQRCCKKIPSYLGKRTDEYKDTVNIKAVACVLIEEFGQIVEAFILDDYHQTQHRGLEGKTPAEMCEAFPITSIPSPEYLSRIDNFRGVECEVTIQNYKGIEKNGLFYNDEGLAVLRRRLVNQHKSAKVQAFYSEIDVSKISVVDPLTGELFTVPCTSIKEPISLAESKARINKVDKNSESKRHPETATNLTAAIKKRVLDEEKAKDKIRESRRQKANESKHENDGFIPEGMDEVLESFIEGNDVDIRLPPKEIDSSPDLEEPESPSQRSRIKRIKPIKV